MAPAQAKVQECLDELRGMLAVQCPACTYYGDGAPDLPCYCFEDFAAGARSRLKEAKKARKIERRAMVTQCPPKAQEPRA